MCVVCVCMQIKFYTHAWLFALDSRSRAREEFELSHLPRDVCRFCQKLFVREKSEGQRKGAKMPRIMIKGGIWKNTEVRSKAFHRNDGLYLGCSPH